ncbi:MAG: hypothetical protein IPQ03_02425 [Bacteroidetes bacterium]|nr:hypothetical protein [Bacteroidota bacterium]
MASTKMRRYLPLLILVPLLFLSIPNAHDWGDDFAQYLMQGRNLVEGRAQTDNGLIFDSGSGQFAVQAYPVGFPLLIAPIIATYGLQIKPLLIFETFCLVALAFLCFQYFRTRFSILLSCLMLAIFVYHPFTLDLKSQVLSEIPFTLVLFGILYLLQKNRNKFSLIGIGLLIALLVSIRITGILILPALFLHAVFQNIKKDQQEIPFRFNELLFIFIPAIAFFLLLNTLLIPVPLNNFFGFYAASSSVYGFQLQQNLAYYTNQLGQVLVFPIPTFSVWKYIVAFMIGIGWYREFVLKRSYSEWFTLLYLTVLLFYPYTSAGFRFIFPVFPFLVFYFFRGLEKSIDAFHFKKTSRLVVPFAILLLLFPVGMLIDRFSFPSKNISGPQSEVSKQLFTYIHDYTSKDAVLVFPRARAMALYGERKVTYRLEQLTADENDDLFEHLGVSYLILPVNPRKYGLFDSALTMYYQANSKKYALAWRNDAFEVYHRQ